MTGPSDDPRWATAREDEPGSSEDAGPVVGEQPGDALDPEAGVAGSAPDRPEKTAAGDDRKEPGSSLALAFFVFVPLVVVLAIGGWMVSEDWRAIGLVKRTKLTPAEQLAVAFSGKAVSGTVEDYVNAIAAREPTVRFRWSARKAPQGKRAGHWLVGFVRDGGKYDGWGFFWLANVSTGIVRRVTGDPLLEAEFGMSPLDRDAPFTLQPDDYAVYEGSEWSGRKVIVAAFGRIKNDTDRVLHAGNVRATWTATFSDEKVLEEGCYFAHCKLLPKLSSRRVWPPGEWRAFKITLSGIDPVYQDYQPRSAVLRIRLDVQDPLGFSFDKALAEIPLDWRMLRGVKTDAKLVVHARSAALESTPGGRKITTVRKGDVLTATERRQRYYRVTTDAGREGWIYYEKVRRVRDQPAEAEGNAGNVAEEGAGEDAVAPAGATRKGDQ